MYVSRQKVPQWIFCMFYEKKIEPLFLQSNLCLQILFSSFAHQMWTQIFQISSPVSFTWPVYQIYLSQSKCSPLGQVYNSRCPSFSVFFSFKQRHKGVYDFVIHKSTMIPSVKWFLLFFHPVLDDMSVLFVHNLPLYQSLCILLFSCKVVLHNE